mmetsp:Transcript_26860/g.40674  ORF Transcript_26860/g.40674 Transcript_26860/m.40674 type:complete len:232 (-) Transcript_26860:285-980(-)
MDTKPCQTRSNGSAVMCRWTKALVAALAKRPGSPVVETSPCSGLIDLLLLVPLLLELLDPALGQWLPIGTVRRHPIVVKLRVEISLGTEHVLRIELLLGLLLCCLLRLLVFATSGRRGDVFLLFQAALAKANDSVEDERSACRTVLVHHEETIPLELEAIEGFGCSQRLLELRVLHLDQRLRVDLLEEVICHLGFLLLLGRTFCRTAFSGLCGGHSSEVGGICLGLEQGVI